MPLAYASVTSALRVRPTTARAAARVQCTTLAPATSSTPRRCSAPSGAQIQCAGGA